MSAEVVSREDQALDAIRDAMNQATVRLTIVPTYFGPAKEAVQIEVESVWPNTGRKRWTKVPPLLFAPDGADISEVFRMLLEMRGA